MLALSRVLVTGGAGLVGHRLVDQLITEGYEVVVVDNFSTGTNTRFEGDQAELVRADIRDYSTLRETTSRADFVVHLAANTSVPYSLENPVETHEVNVVGTVNALRASVDNEVHRFVYASSCAVYGEARHIPIGENHPLHPLSPYAQSKIDAEEYCRKFRQESGLQTVCMRFFNVYGTGNSHNHYSGVVTQFFERLRRDQPPMIYGTGEQFRDFVHVDDVVGAIIKVMESPRPPDEVYNIGSGNAVRIQDLAEIITRSLRKSIQPVHLPPRAGDIMRSQADITKATSELGFRPRISFEEGLKAIVNGPITQLQST